MGKKGGEFTTNHSVGLRGTFQAACRSKATYSKPSIESLLRCYRYFAEIRNCRLHNGNVCNKTAEEAYIAFSSVAFSLHLGLNEVPHHDPISSGAVCSLKLRGVIGLCDVILRLIATTDAELSECENAERPFIERAKMNAQPGRMLPADPDKRVARIKLLLDRCGFPKPIVTPDLISLLIDYRIISRL